MHADELEIDIPLVRRLLADQFPELAGLPLEPVASPGTDNAIYRLGSDLALRLPRIHWAAGQPALDARWLPGLAPLLPLPIPVPLATGAPGQGYPWSWSVVPWLAGETAHATPIADLERAATDLAALVAALHRLDPADGPPPGTSTFARGEPLALRDGATRTAIASLGDAVDAEAVSAAWEAALRAPEWEGAPVWLHGDLDARNVLVQDDRLSGVIDFGCLSIGDPACDVAVVWKMLSAGTRDIFRTALAIDDATWARSRGWALSQALIALPYYTMETNPVLVTEARRWIAAIA
jgi:aminoglycoside phosphotransferase (APT) family kinase protein